MKLRNMAAIDQGKYSRSRKGAWIEILIKTFKPIGIFVAPARERGLKYWMAGRGRNERRVAPARERGLKYKAMEITEEVLRSLPQGSVD